jgi:lipoprotein-anchoring transpeptidase ErfK/SrfK
MHKGLVSVLLALVLTLMFSGIASAKYPDGEGPVVYPAHHIDPAEESAISLTYAQIINGSVPVYASLSDAAAGLAPVNWLAPGFVFVSLAGPSPVAAGNQKWYQLYEGGYVSATHILVYPPSKFQGVRLDQQPDQPFAFLVAETRVSSTPGARPAADALKLTRYSRVTILDRQDVNGTTWYRVGDGEWVSQYQVGVVSVSPRPSAIGPLDKWIEVNLYEQTLAAYEGDQMVYATLVSSGLPQWPTTPGLFQIYVKVKQGQMSGAEGQPDYYYLQDIPWIMYFDDQQALHTAYWHDGFGLPHSHGCINLAPQDALWLFNWTTPDASQENYTFATRDNPGTWVWVHY